ncbi:rhodanese-like/PpiC domain-containing protein 12, chloroplastic [Trifolium pratense]|uniref:rhodanese-like/PpiC domain-containing protein 12, chloroplastic n=1 Tax=Trifolium pratense TaxID=57577 RepID=UPI001E692D9A|nr:rhodanese-like/PpiC domain-containing protein 12, chloroplastic [Trifolium pratense]
MLRVYQLRRVGLLIPKLSSLSTIPSFSFYSHSHSHSQIHTFSSTETIHFQSHYSLTLSPFTSPKQQASYSSGVEGGREREILVQHLLVKEDDQKLLLDLQKRISAGEDLKDLAVDHSICPSKDEGGVLGWVRKGQMVPELEEAVFNAPLNKVVMCKTEFGWHLLQVLSEREESVFEDIQPDELHVKLQDPNFSGKAQLIDIREPQEVDKASLPGFKVLSLLQFGKWGTEINSKFDLQKDTYVLCHHGIRSLQVARWLQSKGFRKVYNISGGIHAYAEQVNPSVPTYARENFGERTPFNILAGHPFKTANFYLRGKASDGRK